MQTTKRRYSSNLLIYLKRNNNGNLDAELTKSKQKATNNYHAIIKPSWEVNYNRIIDINNLIPMPRILSYLEDQLACLFWRCIFVDSELSSYRRPRNGEFVIKNRTWESVCVHSFVWFISGTLSLSSPFDNISDFVVFISSFRKPSLSDIPKVFISVVATILRSGTDFV